MDISERFTIGADGATPSSFTLQLTEQRPPTLSKKISHLNPPLKLRHCPLGEMVGMKGIE